MNPSDTPRRSGNRKSVLKLAVLATVIAAAAIGYWKFGDTLSLDYLASREADLRDYRSASPVLVVAIAFTVYVSVTGLSLPGAAVLTLVFGWFFGFGPGLLIVSFASTAGATLAFLLSRFLLRETVETKFGDRLERFNAALRREGAFYLFTLRLIPAIPFFVINLVMGLTPLRATTFWWVSQLGMLPGTAVFVYAGAQVPTLTELAEKGAGGIITPRLIAAFVLLGIFPIAVKKVMAKFGNQKKPSDTTESTSTDG